MLIVAGLGNPGLHYKNNRHNIGFMAVDALQKSFSFPPWSKKFQAEISNGFIDDEKTLLIKPQTFMNSSGQSVGEALRFYKLSINHLIVFYDELDLQPGTIRTKIGGGGNGHNGIKSIDNHCGNNYQHVRLGIGRPNAKELVQQHVLGNFMQSDQEWLSPLLDAIANSITFLIKGNDSRFMNEIVLAMRKNNKA
ncbi:aminoacyl-tRNA hydrolase [Bartonella ancashensis]|uniref:Peptidyl-tRNA hydrolase n=1 Tax=Bartonella ancashensis TaxID=1318743 RepID=A0A0M4M3H8_9HYPH|nr:aminoacyl-tRNA hydrolase [Bartonella ancashensis]ALE03574.1 Peptidyl-tRNA hydrolase [Bartonella ancashensis]